MKKMIAMICLFSMVLSFAGCSKKESGTSASSSETEATSSSEEDKKGLFDATFTVDTTISYSDGDSNNWAYGNQRKEFSVKDECYVRIASTAKTDKKKGVDEEIKVIYRFTGAKNCEIELTDGKGAKIETDDPDVVEFEGTLYPKKEKKAKEELAIFKYDPSAEGSVTLEVVYDDNVDIQYDQRNTVYFVKDKKEDGAH